MNQLTPQPPRAYCEITRGIGVMVGKQGERRGPLGPVWISERWLGLNLRVKPRGHQLNGVPPVNCNLCKVGVLRGQFDGHPPRGYIPSSNHDPS